jgi:hypothetical protein
MHTRMVCLSASTDSKDSVWNGTTPCLPHTIFTVYSSHQGCRHLLLTPCYCLLLTPLYCLLLTQMLLSTPHTTVTVYSLHHCYCLLLTPWLPSSPPHTMFTVCSSAHLFTIMSSHHFYPVHVPCTDHISLLRKPTTLLHDCQLTVQ